MLHECIHEKDFGRIEEWMRVRHNCADTIRAEIERIRDTMKSLEIGQNVQSQAITSMTDSLAALSSAQHSDTDAWKRAVEEIRLKNFEFQQVSQQRLDEINKSLDTAVTSLDKAFSTRMAESEGHINRIDSSVEGRIGNWLKNRSMTAKSVVMIILKFIIALLVLWGTWKSIVGSNTNGTGHLKDGLEQIVK